MSFEEYQQIFENLNEEFNVLKGKINILINKYSDLESKLENNFKARFKCRKCDETFENVRKFERHKEKSTTCYENPFPYQCEMCELEFTSEKQCSTHKEKHGHFKCDKCDKVFTFEGVLEKHVSAAHGSTIIFCHYYNNNKVCPFKNECIFAHLESKDCIFGNECERMFCMFRHEEHFQNDEEECEEEYEEESDENDESDDVETFRLSEIEPALTKVELAMEKVNNLINSQRLKCDSCEFKAKNQNGLNMHKKAKHGDKSA